MRGCVTAARFILGDSEIFNERGLLRLRKMRGGRGKEFSIGFTMGRSV